MSLTIATLSDSPALPVEVSSLPFDFCGRCKSLKADHKYIVFIFQMTQCVAESSTTQMKNK